MRNFFCAKPSKSTNRSYGQIIARGLTCFYLLAFIGLSYRLVYNQYYAVIHDDVEVSYEEGRYVYPLGEIVGLYTECEGVFVIDTCEIETEEEDYVNPAKNILCSGDYILQANGIDLEEKEDLVQIVNQCKGEAIELQVKRGETYISTSVTPIMGKNGKYMIGVWVKDDIAGVGTITYYTNEGDFAALGHGMGDGVTSEIWSVDDGDVYFTDLVGIQKGNIGEPGEVKGLIYYGRAHHLGELAYNCREGIFGTLDKEDVESFSRECEAYEVGNKQEIEIGAAQIISDVSGVRQIYDIEILYVDYLAVNTNKCLHIEVTDPELLELTGGIIQGMSGSPILQDGKIVGAVTHVLVNDPTRGYGIFIENMMDAARQVAEENKLKDAS